MNELIQRLIYATILHQHELPYVNLNEDNKYKGWVDDFQILLPNGNKMRLDLTSDVDQFLLFVLAISWSRSGYWENGAYLVTYLKANNLGNYLLWQELSFVRNQISISCQSALETINNCTANFEHRINVAFRNDIFSSIHVLANNWVSIKSELNNANIKNNFLSFRNYIYNIRGLGNREKRMNMKILLILRELKCQNIFPNIPGTLCCVPDNRVKKYAPLVNLKLPINILKSSEIIYEQFGDLYDIPLFAYPDLLEMGYL